MRSRPVEFRPGFEVLYGYDKRASFDGQREVDGIEVGCAVKATGKPAVRTGTVGNHDRSLELRESDDSRANAERLARDDVVQC